MNDAVGLGAKRSWGLLRFARNDSVKREETTMQQYARHLLAATMLVALPAAARAVVE